jgi:hypothetical protein
MARTLNKRRHKIPKDAVYVGRPTKWGNPFTIGKDGTRVEVVEKHKEWIKTQPQLLACLCELRDKDLVCWCAPLACHADTLRELANVDTLDINAVYKETFDNN